MSDSPWIFWLLYNFAQRCSLTRRIYMLGEIWAILKAMFNSLMPSLNSRSLPFVVFLGGFPSRCQNLSSGAIRPGGLLFFFWKTILSDFTFYAIFNIKKYWKVPLHLLVKWAVVSPNSREGQLESISIISSMPLFWFCISNGGGGV